jgi:NAD(P)-dependent dehydrogenase (short-subunit alcohol dehydrogenase family)
MAPRTLYLSRARAGGDSGIGRAVALHFAREGAHVAVMYLNEHQDAKETEAAVVKEGRKCLLFAGDVGDEKVRTALLCRLHRCTTTPSSSGACCMCAWMCCTCRFLNPVV